MRWRERRERTGASVALDPAALDDPVVFAGRYLPKNEKRQPWSLSRHQRRVLGRAFRRDSATGRLLRLAFTVFLWSEPKKSGKTLLAAMLALWWALRTPHTEILVVANDLEQAVGRVFKTMVDLVEANPELAEHVTIRAEKLLLVNGTVVQAIAADYRGAAGSRHSLVVFDELWGTTSEAMERLYEELTPPPTEADAWVLIVSYAGFTGESKLLEALYHRGLAGTRVDDELELYEADGLCMFWGHTPRMPWQTGTAGERYYAEQRRHLRESTYRRLHQNEWVSSESTFITPELWDACLEPAHAMLMEEHEESTVWGLDVALKGDGTALVGVWRDESTGQIVVVHHRLWTPKPGEPVALGEVERTIVELSGRFEIARLAVDPFQAVGLIQRLQAAGIPAVEYVQSVPNTTRMGQTLMELIRSQNLVVYPDVDLRQQACNVIAVDTPHGWRLAKEKSSRKIDLIAALSMACVTALEQPVLPPARIW
jgi:phage terminase large subunit-like protein